MTSTPPVLILIHGATMNRHMWDPVRHHLLPDLRVLAPDLPGHGTRRGERFTLEGAVATVAEAARSVADAPVVLAGDSLGGYTALASARAVPAAQLRGLVLSGCTANLEGFATLSHFVAKSAMFRVLLALFGDQRLVGAMTGKVRKMLLDAGVQAEDADALLAAGLSVKVFPEAVQALRGIDFRSQLAALQLPVALVNGDQDSVMLRQERDFLAAAQRATRHRFDCGHGVSLLKSEELAALITRCMAEWSAPAESA